MKQNKNKEVQKLLEKHKLKKVEAAKVMGITKGAFYNKEKCLNQNKFTDKNLALLKYYCDLLF